MYFDHANNDWVAAVSLSYKAGKRVRRKVTGRTKTEVKAKLEGLRRDLDSSVRSSATCTVGNALDDWLANRRSGTSARTKELYQDTVKPLRERLGDVKLREFTAGMSRRPWTRGAAAPDRAGFTCMRCAGISLTHGSSLAPGACRRRAPVRTGFGVKCGCEGQVTGSPGTYRHACLAGGG
jgi:hypothetical protein